RCIIAPPSDSNLNVIADCNSITDVYASNSQILVRMTSGQCIAQTRGCPGPRDDGHWLFLFSLGTWQYLGDATDPSLLAGNTWPPTGQTADPQGRTWTMTPADSSQRSFVWQASGNPNAPPVANAVATNLSA